jgi:predicted nucleic acid-binding protein
MILVDTSVVVDHLRGVDPRIGQLFRKEPVTIYGITRAEILHGAKNRKDRSQLIILLDSFLQVAISESIWDQVGDNLATLRARGVTAYLPDVTIATLALGLGCELWARDKDFVAFQTALPALRLFVEPL